MLLIGPGRLFTRNAKNESYARGGLVTEGDKIVAVGDFDSLRETYKEAEWVDTKGQLILPAFINAHHHIYSALARGLSVKNYNPKNFLEILSGMWWNLDEHLTLADSKASAVATYIACIENGVASIFDHHASYQKTEGSLEVIAQEALRFGVRSCLCYEISDRNGEAEMKKAVKENVDFIEAAKAYPGQLVGTMGMHAPFTLSDATLTYCMSQNPAGAGYHIHVAEGAEDVTDSLEKYGIRPVERLHRLGLLGEKTIAGHCIHLTEEEKDLLDSTGTIVVHNPESNMGNAVGYPDVLGMYKRGILLGLGTDGYTSDMMESYKVANCLVKFFNHSGAVGWSEIPDMLFHKNAEIVQRFFGLRTGVLEVGAAADVIAIDYTPYTPLDAGNLNGHLLFGVNGAMVQTTVTQGKLRMKDRELVGLDKEALLAECELTAKDLWARVNA